jgi:hypothetical protein
MPRIRLRLLQIALSACADRESRPVEESPPGKTTAELLNLNL